jgi:aminopeptidase YwaD
MKVSIKALHGIMLVLWWPAALLSQTEPAITIAELRQHVSYLASEELAGRYPGTGGDRMAAEYIAGEFEKAGAKLYNDHGYQYFELVSSMEAGDGSYLRFRGREGRLAEDFIPLSFSGSAGLEATVAFAGYGFQVSGDSLRWDDYAGIDVGGKWVMIFPGEPSVAGAGNIFSSAAGLRGKVLTAKDHGAAGVIFVSGPAFDEDDKLFRMFYDKSASDAGIPVIHMKRQLADSLLAPVARTIGLLEQEIAEGGKPASFETDIWLEGAAEVIQQRVTTMNILAWLPGNDPLLAGEVVVIGAHYDHLGMGGPGSGSREPDARAVHYGADDNASGVAGIIEIAERIAAAGDSLRRTVAVVAFGAEEMGLVGSGYFIENRPPGMENIVAMFNFDMIGRLNDKGSISIGGTGTSLEAEELLKKQLESSGLEASFSKEGFGPSDHAGFYAADIPVFFISTGAHGDYHTSRDVPELINYEGLKAVADFSRELIMAVANRDDKLTFSEAGDKYRRGQRYDFKVTLGIVPDFTGSENNGLLVSGVRSDGPAARGGMLKDDVITALDGMAVGNIYDYMARLKKLEPGQIITVDVIRNGEKMVLIVQL